MAGLVTLASVVVVPRVEARLGEEARVLEETDQRILEELHATIAPLVSGPIVLSVVEREVSLEGNVPSTEERDAIVAAAGSGEDVRRVVDRLVVTDDAPDVPGDPEQAPPEPLAADPTPEPEFEPEFEPEPAAEAVAEPDAGIDLDADPRFVDEYGESLVSDEERLALAGPTAGPRPDPEPGELDPDVYSELGLDLDADFDPALEPEPGPDIDPAPEPDALPRPDAGTDATTDPTTAPDPDPARMSLRVVEGALQLDGAVAAADADRLAAFVGPAIEAFDPSYLENTVQTRDDIAQAAWLDALTSLLVPLAGVSAPTVEIDADRLIVAGAAASEQARTDLVEGATRLFPDHTLVERIVVAPPREDAPPEPTTTSATTSITTTSPDSTPGSTSASAPPSTALSVDAPAAATPTDPAAARAALQREFDALGDRAILFALGTADFAGDSAQKIERIAELLLRHPGVRVEIEGHTDASGPARANLALSQQRANAVRDALVAAGVPRQRLVAYGYGEGVPLVDNATAEGRARNRRIEFRF